MSDKLDRNSRKLIELFRNCQYTDIIGIGNILGVQEQDEFDDYLTEIIIQYRQIERSKQKALLKLVKDITKANKEMVADPKLIGSLPAPPSVKLKEREIKEGKFQGKFKQLLQSHTPGNKN